MWNEKQPSYYLPDGSCKGIGLIILYAYKFNFGALG